MGALSLVQSDTQTQNDKKTRSPHFFLSKIQGATGCFCLFTALLPGANYETPAPLSTGILIFFRAAFSAKKPMPNAGLQLNRARQPGSVFFTTDFADFLSFGHPCHPRPPARDSSEPVACPFSSLAYSQFQDLSQTKTKAQGPSRGKIASGIKREHLEHALSNGTKCGLVARGQ